MLRLAGLLCVVVACAACSEPPQKEIDRAQGAIDAARAAGAERYASSQIEQATTALRQANETVAQGDYRLALSYALDAYERAREAAREAADSKARARGEAERVIAGTATSLQQLRAVLEEAEAIRVPARDLAAPRKTAQAAEAALQKARELLKAEQYLDTSAALTGMSDSIAEQIQALNAARNARAGRRRR